MSMNYTLKEEGKFKYIETGSHHPETLVLLHGLMGALSNFTAVINHFSKTHNVVVPMLPIYELPIYNVSIQGFVDYVVDFVEFKDYNKIHLLGNSLGGHIALLYTLACPQRVQSVILTGSSGLFESAMGNTFPRRGDYDYIANKARETFFDPEVADKALIDDIFSTVNDRSKAIRIVATSKSAIRHNLSDKLHQIKAPTLLIWGKNDIVTPPFVGEKFHELIENSELIWLEKCGHAPMMEHPILFNRHLEHFLKTNAIMV
jgi:2-hydroxy-6-oxonona-2,4-dienedioate hydrolase